MSMGHGRIFPVGVAILLATTGCNGDDASDPPTTSKVGLILVRVTTTGTDLDDRYDASIGIQHRSLSTTGYASFTVTPGSMVVKLEGVAPNCVIAGEDARTVTVDAGQTVQVEFAVSCLATGLLITTHTTGSDFPDGYTIGMTGFNPRSIGINQEYSFSRLGPGTYTASLGVPGENCTVVSEKEVTAVVTNRELTPVRFDVECSKPTRLEKIAFTDDSLAGNEPRIFLARTDGSDVKLIARGESPSWSSDGSWVAYTARVCEPYYYYYSICGNRLVITDPEIGKTRQIPMSFSMDVSAPAWSPAGERIAFIRSDSRTLYLISPDGGSAQLVPINAQQVNDPSWSPDGQRIALTCIIDSDNLDVCIVNVDGSGLTRLTTGAQKEFDPAWSSDGKTIAFVTNASGSSEIATMAIDGTGFQKVTEGFSPSWSRGGAAIAFSRADGLFTIHPDGSALTTLTTGRRREIAWRP